MVTLDSGSALSHSTHEVSNRTFGLFLGAVLWGVGSLPLLWGGAGKLGLWVPAGLLLAAGWLAPSALHWPKRLWLGLTGMISKGVNFALLGLIFFGVVTPVALWFRLLGRDALRRQWDPQLPSYWVARDPGVVSGSMKRQF